ncbi:MAG TPA: hypothetical protein VIO60_07825 [Rectinemataceae bacterium]
MKKALGCIRAAVCVCLALASAAGAFAQGAHGQAPKGEQKPIVFDEFPSSLGVSFITPETIGLSWKRWYGKTALELSAGGFWNPSNDSGSRYRYSVMGAVSRRLYADDFANWFSGGLYLVALAGHSGEEGVEWDMDTSSYTRLGYQPAIYAGAGLGIETVLFRHFSQELQFVYVGKFLSDPGIGFALNVAVRYRY